MSARTAQSRRFKALSVRHPLTICLGDAGPEYTDYVIETNEEGSKQLSVLGVEREESNVSPMDMTKKGGRLGAKGRREVLPLRVILDTRAFYNAIF